MNQGWLVDTCGSDTGIHYELLRVRVVVLGLSTLITCNRVLDLLVSLTSGGSIRV